MNSCYDLTIDICVLMSGSGTGNKKYRQTSLALLEKMKGRKYFSLALDNRRKILNQYWEKLKGTYGEIWIRDMIVKGKINIVPWRNINRSIIVALQEVHFPVGTEDFNYVVTASGTNCKCLVSHDRHYSNRACRVLRRKLEIRVKTAYECHNL